MTPRHDRSSRFLRHSLAIAALLCSAACGGGNEAPAAHAQAPSVQPQGDAARRLGAAVVLPAVPGSGPAGAAALPDGL